MTLGASSLNLLRLLFLINAIGSRSRFFRIIRDYLVDLGVKSKSESFCSDGSNFICVGARARYLAFPSFNLVTPSIREQYFLKCVSASHFHRRSLVSVFFVKVTGQIVSGTVWTSIQANSISCYERSDSDSKGSCPAILFLAKGLLKIADGVVPKFKLILTYVGVNLILKRVSFPKENFWCEREVFKTSL